MGSVKKSTFKLKIHCSDLNLKLVGIPCSLSTECKFHAHHISQWKGLKSVANGSLRLSFVDSMCGLQSAVTSPAAV